MAYVLHSRIKWYMEHRVNDLRKRQERLKYVLDDVDAMVEPDFDMWREFVQITGRIRELEHLLSCLDTL